MKTFPIEKLFEVINETTEILQEELKCTYLEALAETGDNLFHQKVMQAELSELTEKRLAKKYSEIQLSAYHNEEIRKAYQFAILKGMKNHVQQNHQMTPDTIGYFISYLLPKFMNGKNEIRLLDHAAGTGNLLTTILNKKAPDVNMHAYAVEVDDILIRLAYTGANLLMHPIELFHQDGLGPLLIDPVDAVVCDLPVGYYPNDERAAEFTLKSDEGHSYAHHLFIEQGLNYTKPGGYLFFLIPNDLFETKEAPKLKQFLKETAYIQAVLQLPFSMFANSQAAKSIFIIQKKKPGIKPPQEVLLAALPKLSNKEALDKILVKMEKWFQENK
ncbi:class I SAM-dependent methyltransferase [Siminovitchia sp. FSL H7-0308]|uniref:Site-specific DNA-methyltransferase (Adenine-specific) n=1 Tax=Siminovitchia thermophila TaxID=1245522 RepID=A0ABS2R6C7_9BACI|nr:class I SAM-dependent methyltransferase [Siminovitchia thermophila]MBM7715212.1 site-specific DNA-methyltransferase (adenine-specific) [Siminovitchia thermophila]ONK24055.1 SAM-dependent methyltransferase [Bacillus sp. VT-16-64]